MGLLPNAAAHVSCCFHRSVADPLRKGAFHLVLAGHTYNKLGFKRLPERVSSTAQPIRVSFRRRQVGPLQLPGRRGAVHGKGLVPLAHLQDFRSSCFLQLEIWEPARSCQVSHHRPFSLHHGSPSIWPATSMKWQRRVSVRTLESAKSS